MDRRTSLLIRPRRIERSGERAARYTIELELGDGRRFVSMEPAQFDLVPPVTVDPDTIRQYGQELFRRLFPERLGHAFQVARTTATMHQQPLRLRLALDPFDPVLHAIPWELLHLPATDGLSRPTPLATNDQILFSRYLDSERYPLTEPLDHRPIRMLLVLSEPTDLQSWGLAPFDRLATERDLLQRFKPFVDSGQLVCDALPIAEASAWRSALERGALRNERDRGYDAVLYMGHALFLPQHGTRLLLEHGPQRRGRLFDGAEFVRVCEQLPVSHKPALIALVACNSATVDLHAPLSNLAASLVVESGIPAVIAMQRLVAIDLARHFTQHLTEMLLRNGMIDLAVTTARRRIYQADSISWSTPVLYTRLASGRLFQPSMLLSYVEWLLQRDEIRRWAGPDYIDVSAIVVAHSYDWQLLQQRPEDAPGPSSARDTLLSLTSSSAAISANPFIALTGSRQSGQTTILRRVCHDLARQALHDPTAPIGVFISLAGYEQARGELRLHQHIVDQVRQQHPGFADLLERLFRGSFSGSTRRPQMVFLLDDLEQLSPAIWKDLVRDLTVSRQRLPDQSFVIAAIQTFAPLAFEHNARVLVLQPLDEAEIVAYIRQRYHRQARRMIEQIRENRLQSLASDSGMLQLIIEQLADSGQREITHQQVLEEFLARELRDLDNRYHMSDIARESLYQIAWQMCLCMRDQLAISDLFAVLAQVRGNRDYNLEDLFLRLSNTQILTIVGQRAVRFSNQAVFAYCAAQALCRAPDRQQQLLNIVAMCADAQHQRWWEHILYILAGLLADPAELLDQLARSLRAGNERLALLAARCLEGLPARKERALPLSLRNEIIDTCLIHLDERREPSAERREQLISALGKLDYIQVRQHLRHVLISKVRQTTNGPRYEYTNVRIAAARALRDLYAPDFRRVATSRSRAEPFDRASISLRQLCDDRPLIELMRHWLNGEQGRCHFRERIVTSPLPPERALAAFALADVSATPTQQLQDIRFLLRVITRPLDNAQTRLSDDWIDTMWAAADALTLFDAEYVTPLLVTLIRHKRSMPNAAAQQLAYLAGRLRIDQPVVIDWLIALLITNPAQSVKARALQSLAWIGREASERTIALADSPNDDSLTIKQLIEEIALWRQPFPRFTIGEFILDGASNFSTPLYLRRKAIEALAWIGDRSTLRELDTEYATWPLELRAYWYTTRDTIQQRINHRPSG